MCVWVVHLENRRGVDIESISEILVATYISFGGGVN
jgi:hypothetical protein